MYKDYNWKVLYREGKLKKLKVAVLDMYIAEHELKHSRGALKQEKVDIVTAHIARSIVHMQSKNKNYNNNNIAHEENDESEDSEEEDDDEDAVIGEIGNDDDEDDDYSSEDGGDENSDEEDESNEEGSIRRLFNVTRSGRMCRTWRGRAAGDFYY